MRASGLPTDRPVREPRDRLDGPLTRQANRFRAANLTSGPDPAHVAVVLRSPPEVQSTASNNKEGGDDAALVKAARRGDRAAFGELVGRYQVVVCSLALALTGSEGHGEEIAQEAFLVAWRRLGELRHPERFRSFLYGIVRNLARSQLRHRIFGRDRGSTAEVVSGAPSPLEHVIDRQEGAALWRALGAVPETYRVPLLLHYYHGQSVEEIALAL